jgi:bis(5'-nucleosyl)-tetraphosphatase (symmetrical)
VSTYVIGDVQGCFATLEALLAELGFDRSVDRLWLVGDLVNRGPWNLEVLRFVRELGDAAVAVLGNHDLHLLARAAGVARPKQLDTIDDVLEARDRTALIEWLRRRPIAHRRGRDLMVHAGVHPDWSDDEIDDLADELAAALASDRWADVLGAMIAARQARLGTARGLERLGAISAVFHRVRTLTADGAVHNYSGSPEDAPAGCTPWFDLESRRRPATRVLFGHWAALGLMIRPDCVALDTGCVWGRRLTAFELETGRVVSVATRDPLPHSREAP